MQVDAWAAELAAGTCPAPVREQLYRILFKPDKNAPEYKAVVEAARRTGRAPLELLKASGAIDSPYEFHWRRFLFEHFPRGTAFPALAVPAIVETLPLAPGRAFSIDDSSTTEIDDALSVQGLGSGTITVGIHIAAPALAFAPGSPVDEVARQRLSTVYIPGHKLTMLPAPVVDAFTLVEGREAPVVSLYLTFDEATLAESGSETRLERIAIAANLRHDELESMLDPSEAEPAFPAAWPFAAELAFLHRLARRLKAARELVRGKPEVFNRPDYTFRVAAADGAAIAGTEPVRIEPRRRGSPLDLIVAEAMILANSTWGGWLAECGVTAIYRSQASLAPGNKVRMSTRPAPHAGIGVAQYAWSTSPLRRYVDLVNQWQIIACARHGRSGALAAPFKPEGRRPVRGHRRLRRVVRRVQRVPGSHRALLGAALPRAERDRRARCGGAEGWARPRRRPAARVPRRRRRVAGARHPGPGRARRRRPAHARRAGAGRRPARRRCGRRRRRSCSGRGGGGRGRRGKRRRGRRRTARHRRRRRWHARRRRRCGARCRHDRLSARWLCASRRSRSRSPSRSASTPRCCWFASSTPEAFNRIFQDTPLEVILVNSRSGEPPEKAQAIAQANLAGGGDAAAGRATSPLPPSALTELGDANEETRKQIEQLQQTQQQLLTQVRRELALLPATDPMRDQGTPEERAQEERRRQLIEVLAEIEKRINEENARPKKRYISPATREEVYALYYDQLRRKIEERGTRNFPENQGRKLYGELTMNVTVDAEGRVVETEVVRGSSSKILDRRAVAIVMAAAPYGRFSPAMRKKADQLVITSRFRFTREENLETSLSASQ